jgi:phthalate 4,5-dioxygenase oxygenase subunit
MNYPPPLPGDRSNRWGQDREAMRRGSFSGFPQHLAHEDQAAGYSQGKIAKRTREYLNAGDAGVVRMRNWLLSAVKDFEAGLIASPVVRTINAGQGVIAEGEDWRVQDFFGPTRPAPAPLVTP